MHRINFDKNSYLCFYFLILILLRMHFITGISKDVFSIMFYGRIKKLNRRRQYILKDKGSAPLKVKNHIKSSCGWILFKFSHEMDLYVNNDLTKSHVLIIDYFVINRHNITHSLIFRFPVSNIIFAHTS